MGLHHEENAKSGTKLREEKDNTLGWTGPFDTVTWWRPPQHLLVHREAGIRTRRYENDVAMLRSFQDVSPSHTDTEDQEAWFSILAQWRWRHPNDLPLRGQCWNCAVFANHTHQLPNSVDPKPLDWLPNGLGHCRSNELPNEGRTISVERVRSQLIVRLDA